MAVDEQAGELLARIWDELGTALVAYGPDGRRLLVNAPAEAFLAAHGEDAGRVIYLADGESVCAENAWPMRRALRGEIVRAEELVLRGTSDPEGVRIVVTAYPITLPDGLVGALLSFFEVTEEWRHESANRASFEQLNVMLEGARGYAIVYVDAQGLIKSWSRSAAALFGYQEAEILGQSFGVFFLPEDRAAGQIAEVLERSRHSGGAQAEGRRVRRDGSQFWAYSVTTPIRDRVGTVTGYVAVVHDVTARYEAERAVEELNAQLVRANEQLEERVAERTALLEARSAELVSANNELEAFSYSVSHDLRAPVRAVQGFARIVGDRYGDLLPAEGRVQLERIATGAQRMGALVDSLLRLSRMQRQPMVTAPVDMTRLVELCWAELDEHYAGHRVSLALSPLLPAEGDPQLLQQVWMNLLDNAIKYSGGSPAARVDVSSQPGGEGVIYQIRDNGAGFDQRYADKLFRAFQRLHGDDEFTGIGIGLTIVQRVILRHGGEVWASGETGAGATFSFTLRRAGHEPA